MRRGSTRNKASETQSQSQLVATPGTRKEETRKRRKRIVDDDEEEHDEDVKIEDLEVNGEFKTIERKANDLVRLALFTEYRRTSLKREDIAKKIFGGRVNKGEFEQTFERAQNILKNTFGMELFEILSRAERLRADAARDGVNQEGDTNIAGKKKTAVVSSKQYILRSVLDPIIIEALSVHDDEIEEAEKKEITERFPQEENRRPEGTLVMWQDDSGDQLTIAGILHVLLAIILVNGRVLTDMQLRTYLKRLRLPIGSTIPTNSQLLAVKPLTIDALLAQFLKQSYLDKQTTSLATGHGAQRRARGSGTLGEESTSFEWKWGTRAIAEISEESIGAFMVDFMEDIEQDRASRRADEDGRGHNRGESANVAKRKEKLTRAIGRAAGGALEPYK